MLSAFVGVLTSVILFYSHAGCICSEDWTGPHCELHIKSEKETMESFRDESSDSNAANVTESQQSPAKTAVWEAVLLAIGLVLLVVILLCALNILLHHRRRKDGGTYLDRDEVYRDEPNIAPYRDSTESIPNRHHTSSSDPFTAMMVAESEPTRQISRMPNPKYLASEDEESNQLQPVELC